MGSWHKRLLDIPNLYQYSQFCPGRFSSLFSSLWSATADGTILLYQSFVCYHPPPPSPHQFNINRSSYGGALDLESFIKQRPSSIILMNFDFEMYNRLQRGADGWDLCILHIRVYNIFINRCYFKYYEKRPIYTTI